MKLAGLILALAPVLQLAVPSARAQSKSAWSVPRLADGKPDLNGIWQVSGPVDANLEAKLGGKNIIVDPPDGRIPYTREAAAHKKANNLKRAAEDPVGKCYMAGIPRLTYLPYPFQIAESANQPVIAFLSQYAHMLRNINMRGEHLDGLELWLGDSRAHWEGDTLVVDVANFNDQTWLDAAGDFHSGDLHVVERFTRTGPDTIAYEALIQDPKVLTRPFKISLPLARHIEKNFQILESECYAAKEGPTVTVGDKPDQPHAAPAEGKQ